MNILVNDGTASSLPQSVCGRVLTADINYYPCATHHGQKIHFCTEFCLDAFKADPDRFYTAHRQKKDEEKSKDQGGY